MEITKRVIINEYRQAVEDCDKKYPLKRWIHEPATISEIAKKNVYGEATTNGTVYVNQSFLGTTAINKLRYTLRYELARLAVGLSRGHTGLFRRMEEYFCQGITVPEAEIEQLTGSSWRVVARLEDGTSFDFGVGYRKMNKYMNYPDHKLIRVDSFTFKPYE